MMELGKRIRELRNRDGRTQEVLAEELGVTAQAVSRWEKGICYPDMEIIPSIANYFGVSIDELFGYDNDRARKTAELAERINAMNRQNNGTDVNVDECIALARQALIEFPGTEELTCALAAVLYNAGYVRYGEHHFIDEEGYSRYDAERNRECREWQEAMKLYEKVLPGLQNGKLRQKAVTELSQLYKNTGEHEKALQLAEEAMDMKASEQFLRINAFDGREAVGASGEALLETVNCSAELIASIVWSDCTMKPQTASVMLQNAISMYSLVCVNDDYGRYNWQISCLHMLRSYHQWLSNDRDGAFKSLDEALRHSVRYDELKGVRSYGHTSPLLRSVRTEMNYSESDRSFTPDLPDVWPGWNVPEQEKIKKEMMQDPRWDRWEKLTQK